MTRNSLLFAALMVAGNTFAAGAADSVTVADPYVRLAPPNAPATGAFMVLKNTGGKDVKVVKADSAASKVAELHTHLNEGGVMKMRQVPAIEIKAGGEAKLAPGGLHIMMIDMKTPLKEGDMVALTLTFDDGSSKKIEVPVKKMTMMTGMPASGMGGGMDHKMMHH